MSKLIDIKGLKFGKLTVIEKIGVTKSKNALWRCKWLCG